MAIRSADAERLLEEQHTWNARWYLRFRVIAIAGWMGVDYLFGSLRTDLAAAVPYLALFLAVGAVLLAASYRWPFVIEHSWWASPLVDLPFCFAIQYQGVFKAPSPTEAAAFALGLFATLVVLTFFSLRRRYVVATTVVAIFLEAIILDAGQTHAGAIAGSSLLLATIGACGAWLVEQIARLAGTSANSVTSERDLTGQKELTMLCAGVTEASSRDEFQTLLLKLVARHGGMLDKIVGNAVVASFGAGGDLNHASSAVECALDLHMAAADANERRRLRGERPMRLGVGLATGVVTLGNMGSEQRRDYNAMGESVTLATRLQGLAADTQPPILCSARTQALAAGSYEWGGVSGPVSAFAPRRAAGSVRQAG